MNAKNLNQLVLFAEKELNRPGAYAEESESFEALYNCSLANNPKSHVIYLKEMAEKPSFQPCEHRFACVNPYEDRVYNWQAESNRTSKCWAMCRDMKEEYQKHGFKKVGEWTIS